MNLSPYWKVVESKLSAFTDISGDGLVWADFTTPTTGRLYHVGPQMQPYTWLLHQCAMHDETTPDWYSSEFMIRVILKCRFLHDYGPQFHQPHLRIYDRLYGCQASDPNDVSEEVDSLSNDTSAYGLQHRHPY